MSRLPTAPGRRHRRRGDRHQRGLPPDRAGLDRRAAAGAGTAVVRHHLARGRPGRPAARLRGRHPAGAVLHPALRAAGGARPARPPGFRRCGGVTVARTPERMAALARTAATATAYELDCELISPQRAAELYPIMATDDLVGAIWLPGDGRANPTDLTAALARGARQRGATIRERTRVTGIIVRDGTVAAASHRRRRHRGRGRRQLRRAVGQAGRRPVRGHRAAALGRALLRRHRRRSTASTPTCRSCATRTATPTSRRRSAAWSWAASSPRPSRGWRPTRFP